MLAQTSTTRGTFNTSLGLRARGSGRIHGVSGEVEYGTASSGSSVQSQTVRAGLKLAF